MQRWRKTLGWTIGILWSLGGLAGSASAQFPSQNFGPSPGEFGGPPGPGFDGPPKDPTVKKAAESPLSIRDDGTPNAFTDLLDTRPRVIDPYIFVFRAEYLNWHLTNGPSAVPLVTTTNSFGSIGQLGNANTVVLVGSGLNTIDYQQTSGIRLSAGVAIGYIPPIEVSGFYFNKTATVFSGGSLTNPTQVLAIPYQDVQAGLLFPGSNGVGMESAAQVANPNGALGALGGTINISSKLLFWNVEANMLLRLIDGDTLKVDALVGYRHLELDENLNINTQSGGLVGGTTFNGATFPAGIFTTSTNDAYTTTNSFNGGQIGMRTILSMGRWSLFSDLKLGLGETSQKLDVGGSSSLSQLVSGRPTQTLPGGILALPSNSGSFTSSVFSIVPEANLALSFQVNHCLRIFGGYNYLTWTHVTRPGDAITNVLDSRQMPTSTSYTPNIIYNGSGPPSITQRTFDAHGFFIGVEIGF